MRFLKLLILLACIFASFSSFHTGSIGEELSAKLEAYIKSHPSSTLYLHIDRNNYSNNERIWFKAYVLKGKIIDNTSIYVRLVDADNKIILRRQFQVYDLRAHGDLLLPETIKEGKYKLFAYTDRMLNFKEHDVFVQTITVRRDAERMLEARAFVTDTTQLKRGGKVQVTVQVKQGIDLLKNVKGTYVLSDKENKVKSGKISTNLFGEAFIEFVYPQLADDRTLQLKVNFKREKEYAELILNLRHEGNKYTINLYPEGGHFIDGLPCKAIVEVLDVNQNPVSIPIALLNNGKKVTGVTTGSQGFGIIYFTPSKNADYKISISTGGKNTLYPFAKLIEGEGYGLHIEEQNKKALATIVNKSKFESVELVLRSSEDVLWTNKIKLPSGDSTKIRFVLDSLPHSLLSLAIFDPTGALLSERVFLAHEGNGPKLEIKTDSKIYGKRKKVTVSFKTSDVDGNPIPVNFSLAVVEKTSLNTQTYSTILHSYYFSALQGNLSAFLSTQTLQEVDNLLITKKWYYDWADITSSTTSEPIKMVNNTSGVNGMVVQTLKGEFDVDRVSLRSVKNPAFVYNFLVRQDHTFSISPQCLFVADDDELYVKQSAGFSSAYEIVYFTPERDFDKRILQGQKLFFPDIFNAYAVRKPVDRNSSISKTIQLREVKIARENKPVLDLQTGECSDFVCEMNILNCTGHHTAASPGSFTPVGGGRYRYRDAIVTYYGCDDYRFKSIAIPKNFTIADFEKNPLAEPVTGSTIFWKPNISIAGDGNKSITFFTSDLTGDFSIVAQGINVNSLQPFYSSTGFSVK